MWRGPAWMTVARDLALLILPGAGFIIEALKDKPSIELQLLYIALVACPGIAGAIFLAKYGPGGTVPPSQPSAPQLPPPSSSSSSSSED